MQETISSLLSKLIQNREESSRISIAEICEILGHQGIVLLLVLFSFPMAIPLPYPPGLTTILGLPLLYCSVELILKKNNIVLPKKIRDKTIKISHLNFTITKLVKLFEIIEKYTKPRLLILSSSRGEQVIGLISLLCAICITLPIWFGNAVPALGIFMMAFGLDRKDGLVILLGILTSIFGLFIAGTVVVFGIQAVKYLIAKFLHIDL